MFSLLCILRTYCITIRHFDFFIVVIVLEHCGVSKHEVGLSLRFSAARVRDRVIAMGTSRVLYSSNHQCKMCSMRVTEAQENSGRTYSGGQVRGTPIDRAHI